MIFLAIVLERVNSPLDMFISCSVFTINLTVAATVVHCHVNWPVPLMAVRLVPLLSLCQSISSLLTHSTTNSEAFLEEGAVHSTHSWPCSGHTFTSVTVGKSAMDRQKYNVHASLLLLIFSKKQSNISMITAKQNTVALHLKRVPKRDSLTSLTFDQMWQLFML